MIEAQRSMSLVQLWWNAMVRPVRAFEEVKKKPAPIWAFRLLLIFNLMISLTTNLARFLLGHAPLLPSWLTFLPTNRYLLAQVFFMPVLRMAVWILGSCVIHLGIRLAGKPSDMDKILNIGGVQYLVVMPYTFLVDWSTLALGVFDISLIGYIHGGIDLVWSIALQVIGLRVMMGLRTGQALGLSLASTAVTLPLLAIFAR